MKVKDIEEEIEVISGVAGDPEAAKSRVGALLVDVLRAIADGSRCPRKLAAAAVKVSEIDWYA